MKYAMLRNNLVIKIEDCIRSGEFVPLNSLYPPEVCKLFALIPAELESQVKAGWVYKDQEFIEPIIGDYITELNSCYFPDNIGVIYALLQQKEIEFQQAITEQDISIIEAQQIITELELQGIGGKTE